MYWLSILRNLFHKRVRNWLKRSLMTFWMLLKVFMSLHHLDYGKMVDHMLTFTKWLARQWQSMVNVIVSCLNIILMISLMMMLRYKKNNKKKLSSNQHNNIKDTKKWCLQLILRHLLILMMLYQSRKLMKICFKLGFIFLMFQSISSILKERSWLKEQLRSIFHINVSTCLLLSWWKLHLSILMFKDWHSQFM